MRASTIIVAATTLGMLALAGAATPGVRDEHPNLIGGELGGRGIVITLNYERFLTNQFGLGGGFMMIGTSGDMVTIIPLYASLLTGDIHSLYLSAGATLVGGGGSVEDYESTWLAQGSVGYQYHSTAGFFVRPFFTYMVPTEPGTTNDFLIWPGLTIGGSF